MIRRPKGSELFLDGHHRGKPESMCWVGQVSYYLTEPATACISRLGIVASSKAWVVPRPEASRLTSSEP